MRRTSSPRWMTPNSIGSWPRLDSATRTCGTGSIASAEDVDAVVQQLDAAMVREFPVYFGVLNVELIAQAP